MNEPEENINIEEQSCDSEKSILKNKNCYLNNISSTSHKSEENPVDFIKSSDNSSQLNLNNAKTKENSELNLNINCNNVDIEMEVQTYESLLTNDHSYATVENQNVNKDDILLNVSNKISTHTTTTESLLSIDTIDNIISNKCTENENNRNINKDECMPVIHHEIVISKEIITIDNEINKNYSTTQNIKSINVVEEKNNDKVSNLYFIDKHSSLDAIALQYDSSDAEDDSNTKQTQNISNNKNYRNNDVVVLTSDSSDSESDSSSSKSESESGTPNNSSNSDGSDDESQIKTKGNIPKKVFKQKGEFDDLPPIEDLKISVPEVLCDPLGEVAWTVEQMVVVRPKPGKPTLNLDTVLFIEKGQRALGHIFDVFGQVAEPHYCVRFNSSDHIQQCEIKVGMIVYYCPNTPYTSLVFLSELTKMKATDEIGDDEPPQFSDDEEEQAYLANLKNKTNSTNTKDTSNEIPNKRRRGNKSGWQSNHPWNSKKEHVQNHNPNNPKPFYRVQHPWSRQRYPQQNPWHQYNSFPNNQWIARYPSCNEMQTYNDYLGPTHVQPAEMQNSGYAQMQWNSQFQLTSQINSVPHQAFPQTTLVPPFTLPPPPPPPPPPNTNT